MTHDIMQITHGIFCGHRKSVSYKKTRTTQKKNSLNFLKKKIKNQTRVCNEKK